MTVEELKAEAKKLGYQITLTKSPVKMLPCSCGCNQRHRWKVNGKVQVECVSCHLRAPLGTTENEARENWNKLVTERKNAADGDTGKSNRILW